MSHFQDSASPLDSEGPSQSPGEAHTGELLVVSISVVSLGLYILNIFTLVNFTEFYNCPWHSLPIIGVTFNNLDPPGPEFQGHRSFPS